MKRYSSGLVEAIKTQARALERKLAAMEAGSLAVVATLLRMQSAKARSCARRLACCCFAYTSYIYIHMYVYV